MAKWGEGDPRWIVEQRADATNVNNWHWTEKNATGWSKDKLRDLLEGLKIEDDKYCCEIKEVTKLEGEAVANNRKAKLIFFYEWEIYADWKGRVIGSDSSHKGKVVIPNLSEENDPEEIDVNVTANTDKDEACQLKEFIRKQGTKAIQDSLATYIKELKHEFSQGMILTAKDEKENVKKPEQPSPKCKVKEEMNMPVVSTPKDSSVGIKISCKKLKDTQCFNCRSSDIYRALTERDMVRAFTRCDATVEGSKGSSFELFGGTVTGKFKKLDPYKKIVMEWRFKSWPEGHFSQVTLEFTDRDDGAVMVLSQTGIPQDDFDRTSEGWKQYYWDSIRQTFGFGATLF